MLILCRKSLTQSDLTDYKIIKIEGEKKVSLVRSPDRCQCFEIQQKLGG
jgi:lipocalin